MKLDFTDDKPFALELVFSSTEEGTEDKLDGVDVIWKDILPEGKIAMSPGMAKVVPFEVVPEGESSIGSDRITVSMSDLIESYDDQAFKDVTIPDGHPKKNDSALNNTGYVRGLRVVKKGAKSIMQAALGFTEPDAAGKVRRGTVPNVSAGIFLNFVRKHDRKKFRAALNHVALTKTPWMNVEPFKKVFASDDVEGHDFELYQGEFADDAEEDKAATGEIIWNEQDGVNWLREALQAALTPDPPPDDGRPYVPRPSYYVQDISQSKGVALVEEWFKGDRSRWVIPYTQDGDKVTPAPATRWAEGKDALIAASDEDNANKINFDDVSSESVIGKLGKALSDLKDSEGLVVSSVALDRRCRITNEKTGSAFEADFALVDGEAILSHPSDWERVKAPEKTDAARPASVTKPVTTETAEVKFSDDPIMNRVLAARQRRRLLMGAGSRK